MKNNEKGQALVLVLLSLSVVLTLVLYIVSRSIVDISVSSQQEDSVRAFSAAEAGIEKTLITGSSYDSPTSIGTAGATYTTSVSAVAQGTSEFAYPIPLLSGESAVFWLAGHDANGNLTSAGAFSGNSLTVCWGNVDAPSNAVNTPAVEISLYYQTTPNTISTTKISRWAFDQASPVRNPANGFSSSLDSGTCNLPVEKISYKFKKTLTPLPSNLLLMKVRMFYNDSPQSVGILISSGSLPSQGQSIVSSGVAGGSNRKILVFTGWPEFPFFGTAVFSPPGISK